MSNYDGAFIEFVNWRGYNPRSDSKKPTWFRLDNDFVTGPKFFALNGAQKLLGVMLMGLVSQKNGGSIQIDYSYCKTFTGLDDSGISEAIDFFIKKETMCVIRARGARVSRESRKRSHATYITNVTNERNNTNEQDQTSTPGEGSVFDFESAYRRYPRKDGKSKGIKKLRAEIKVAEDFEKLVLAIENYSSSRRGQDSQFTKHFSTFASEWRDWIEYTPDPSPPATPNNTAYRRMAGNAAALETALAALGDKNETPS